MENKRLYRRAKLIAKIYNVPLYVAWQFRFYLQDIKYYIRKHGHK